MGQQLLWLCWAEVMVLFLLFKLHEKDLFVCVCVLFLLLSCMIDFGFFVGCSQQSQCLFSGTVPVVPVSTGNIVEQNRIVCILIVTPAPQSTPEYTQAYLLLFPSRRPYTGSRCWSRSWPRCSDCWPPHRRRQRAVGRSTSKTQSSYLCKTFYLDSWI